MKKFLIATLLCMALTVTMVPMAFAADSNYTECMAAIQEQRTIQDQAHQTAESLRKKGYSDSSAYVQAAKKHLERGAEGHCGLSEAGPVQRRRYPHPDHHPSSMRPGPHHGAAAAVCGPGGAQPGGGQPGSPTR